MVSVAADGVALFFTWLFARAGTHKLRYRPYYLDLVSAYVSAARVVAWSVSLLALVELSLALLLLVPAGRAIGLLGVTALLSLYAAGMAWQYYRGRGDMDCGCSGPGSSLKVSPALVLRNLVCAALALSILAVPGHLFEGIGSAVLSLLVGAGIAGLYLFIELAIANDQAMAEDI